MKTITYKIANVMRSIVVISLVILASFSGIAKGENSNKEAIAVVENEYNAKDFVEAELTFETENWMNNSVEANSEAAETELALETLKYDAKNFVDAEFESESNLNSNVETNNAVVEPELALEPLKYDAKNFVEAEFESENSLNNNAVEPELAIETLKYDSKNFVEAELALENGLNNSVESNNAVVELELAIETLKYDPKNFVKAELAFENSLNSNYNEATEILISNNGYNAQEFVEANLVSEIKNWINYAGCVGSEDRSNCGNELANN